MRAKNIIFLLIIIGIIFMSSALVFLKATDYEEGIKPISIIKSKVSSLFLQQGNPNKELSKEEKEALKEEMSEKYKEYIEHMDEGINIANEFLWDNSQFTDITKSIDGQGINIVADDVSFCIEFDENGIIRDVFLEVKEGYDTITIKKDLDVFVESALSAEGASDYMKLVSEVNIPFKYYLKIPKVIDFVLEQQNL
tara:strand:- start:3515 stop:4102 length:588 start_codon:yes stop_codon:yes gene_type:complete